MKDIQAATMALATPSTQESPFKVKIDVKDLEKVKSIITLSSSTSIFFPSIVE